MAIPATMPFISPAQIATAQAAIVAAAGATINLDVYELPYGAADDPAYQMKDAGSQPNGYSLNSPQLVKSNILYTVASPYTVDTAWKTNNSLNTTSGAMIAGMVYLVAGTVLGTR